MNRRLLLLVLSLAFFAAACTSQGLPASYEDQDRRAEKQFVAACESALDDDEDPATCQCAFYTVAQKLTFNQFLELDEQLKDNPEELSFDNRELLESVSLPCEFTADDIRS